MNLVLSTPTSRGGGNLCDPVWGTAHIAFGERVIDILLVGQPIDMLAGYEYDGIPLRDGEVWFEDRREKSH